MSFDLTRLEEDREFWGRFVNKYGKQLLENGWKSALEPGHLGEGDNWDALDNLLNEVIHSDGKQETTAESDGGGIPGSADYAKMTELLGKYFVTGSYLNDGPYETYQEAADAAGI